MHQFWWGVQLKRKANKMTSPKGFILYRIWYGDNMAYLGRTKQPLQTRIHGHLFQKPMHRSININQVTKIEYAEFPTEADMNVYEIYFINLWKPTLNIDDKCKDQLTFYLPEVDWNEFKTPLWQKWITEIEERDEADRIKKQHELAKVETDKAMRQKWRAGEITEDEYFRYKEESFLG